MLFSLSRYPKRQISKPVLLQQGKVYFMQAIAKEGGGGDHVSVKVKLPSGAEKAPLGGKDVYTGVPRKYFTKDVIFPLNLYLNMQGNSFRIQGSTVINNESSEALTPNSNFVCFVCRT